MTPATSGTRPAPVTEARPLAPVMAGATVLITAVRRSEELAAALQRRGAIVRHAPALSIVPHVDDTTLLAATRSLLADPPDVLVVTTGVGFRAWIEAADAHGIADDLATALSQTRILARGPKARGAIQAAGYQAHWVAASETAAEIAQLLLHEGVAGLHVAVQQHGAGADDLDTVLAKAGARVTDLVLYRWGPPPDPHALADSVRAAAAGDLDAVVFTSAPGAHAWLEAADEAGFGPQVVDRFVAGDLVAAAVGPVTARPLEQRGVIPLQPDRGRLGALLRALVSHYEQADAVAVPTVAGPLVVRARAAVLDGRVLALSPTGIEVLRLLAAAGGDVVSRERVLDVLPGDSRDPHAVEVAIGRLRDAIGRRDVIRTVVKRGYRVERAHG